MIDFSVIGDSIQAITMPHTDTYQDNTPHDDIININNIIIKEFKKTYVNALYPQPKWTTRVFWVVEHSIEMQLNLTDTKKITRCLLSYISDNRLPIPDIDWQYWGVQKPIDYSQMDELRLVKKAIADLKDETGITCHIDVQQHVAKSGIDIDRLDSLIFKLKQQGAIFEPKEGYLKCI